MNPADFVLTPEDQRQMIREAIEHARNGEADAEQEASSPREFVAFLLRTYAAARYDADKARVALHRSVSDAGNLIDALDEEMERRFSLARAIREEREELDAR